MKKHKTYIDGWNGTLFDLANAVGNLRYDSLQEFLHHLSNKVLNDAKNDYNNGKIKLSENLTYLGDELKSASVQTASIWNLCKKYMIK